METGPIQTRFLSLTFIAMMAALLVAAPSAATWFGVSSGSLDPSFGIGGKVTTNISVGEPVVAAIQNDGRIVVGGAIFVGGPLLVRYKPDGGLDSSFGSGGVVLPGLSTDVVITNGIVIQPDGRIVLAGELFHDSIAYWMLIRFLSNGNLDPSFGSGGMVLSIGPFSGARALGILNDGRLLAAGYSRRVGSDGSFGDKPTLVRYNGDGTVDTTFGSNGIAAPDSPGIWDLKDLAIQPDGKIVVAGSHITVPVLPGGVSGIGLARFNPNGGLDTTFGTSGFVTAGFQFRTAATCVAIQSDGKVVAAGIYFRSDFNFDSITVRFDIHGNPDTTFGISGVVISDYHKIIAVSDIAVDPTGRIILAGSESESPFLSPQGSAIPDNNFGLFAYDSQGNVDAFFGTNGVVSTDFSDAAHPGSNDHINAIAIQNDGRILAAGISSTSGLGNRIALARYDSSFDRCIRDDSTGTLLQVNTTTGAYLVTTCSGHFFGGTATLTRRGGIISLQQNIADRRLSAQIDTALGKAVATIQFLSTGQTLSLIDRNINDNVCACQ